MDPDSEGGRPATLTELLDQLDDLVAEASTTADFRRKQKLLERALRIACRFLTRLNRRLEDFIRTTLEASGLEAEGSSLSLRDLADSQPELEVFRDRETLMEFLHSAGDLLEQQGRINRKRLNELKAEAANWFDQMLDQQMGLDVFTSRFEIIRRLICQPPEGFGGGGGSGNPAGGGPAETGGQRASRIIQTLGALATIGGLLAALLLQAPGEKQADAPVKPPAGSPHEIRLLALLLLAALANWLDAQGLIPGEEPELGDAPAGAALLEEELTAGA